MAWTYFTTFQVILLTIALWIFTSYMTRTFPTLQGKRICLVIAHPDDEAMFFSPILRWLTRPELGNVVLILCFSSGDADGIGHIRKEELVKSALHLGVRQREHVVCLEDKNFPDSMSKTWDSKHVSNMLMRYFAPDLANVPSTSAPTASIDAILTFDKQGVSGHPNHISLYHGATVFLRNLMQRHAGWDCPVKLYTLTSTNAVRKYSSIIDAIVTIIICLWRRKERGDYPTPLLTMSTPGDVRKGQQAMTNAHKSQMRWFRWGWIGISRYMILNDLVKQKVV